jgi:hypothetical protein
MKVPPPGGGLPPNATANTKPSLEELDKKLGDQTATLGAPTESALKSARQVLADSRMAIGRKMLLDSKGARENAEKAGLDPTSVLVARTLKEEMAGLVKQHGLDPQLLEACLAALAGGVSAETLFERYEHSLRSTCTPEQAVQGLEIVAASIELVIKYEQQLRAMVPKLRQDEEEEEKERREKWGDEPPVRVRSIAEVLIIANEMAREKLLELGGPEHLVAAAMLEQINETLSELLRDGRLDIVRDLLPSLLAQSEEATLLLVAEDAALTPIAPDEQQAAILSSWRASPLSRAETALYFIASAGPFERRTILLSLAEQLQVPPGVLAHAAFELFGPKEPAPEPDAST